jgi:hypothetical protein
MRLGEGEDRPVEPLFCKEIFVSDFKRGDERVRRGEPEKLEISGIGVGEKELRLCCSPVYVHICKQTFI